MAITAFTGWSATAASNVDLNSIPLDGSVMTAGQVDDAFREMMAQLKSGVAPLASPVLTGTVDLSSASSGQVKFPATQNASSNANTLDDYEELDEATISQASGISASSGTITTASGKRTYTKVGRSVSVTWAFSITNAGTGAANLLLTLPFTAAAAGDRWGVYGGIALVGGLWGTILEGGTTAAVAKYDNTTAVVTGTFTVSATYNSA